MPFPQEELTFGQTQTPANRVARNASRVGQFPGPNVPSQQFSIAGGLAQLNSMERTMLERVVGRLKRQRGSVGSQFGAAFGIR